jgi:uncharacterized protein (TIGR02271 family)
MVRTNTSWNIIGGMDVVGVDDEKVGDVADVQGDYIVVSKGFFFPTDYYIPTSAITSVTDKVYLNVTKDEALNQGWDTIPDLGATGTTGVYKDRRYGRTETTEVYDDRPITDTGRTYDQAYVEEDTVRVGLADEELRAGTREVERGRAQVEKVVTEEQQTIDVPVTEERLTVTRRAATDADVDVDATLEEGTIEIPLRGEEVVVDKQANVREVVEIGKEAVTHTEQVTDTVRSEDVRVRENAEDIDVVDPRSRR